MFTTQNNESAKEIDQGYLTPFIDYVIEHFAGDMAELVDYINLSLRMVNKHMDRDEDPDGVANVIDNLFDMQGAFIACVRRRIDKR